MHFTSLAAWIATALGPVCPTPQGSSAAPHPDSLKPQFNILVVVVEDVGIEVLETYDEVNAWPGTIQETLDSGLYADMPRLREFAQGGVTFTNARSMPNCSPMRAGMYTGRYGMRTGVGDLVRASTVSNTFTELGVDVGSRVRREYLISELASSVGYKSAIFGKWHLALLGPDPSIDQGPNTNTIVEGVLENGVSYQGSGWQHLDNVGGWDEWFVILDSPNVNPQPYTVNEQPDGTYGVPSAAASGDRVRDGGWYGRFKNSTQTVHYNGPDEYTDKVRVDKAVHWMNRQENAPFLCFVPFTLIHTPFHDPRLAGYPIRPVYGDLIDTVPPEVSAWPCRMAMLEALDFEFGRLVDGLSPEVRDQTLIIFVSDNGSQASPKVARDVHGLDLGPTYDAVVDSPRSGFKGSVYDTGTQVPLIVQGPRALVRGVPRSTPVLVDVHVDIFETCRALMQIPYRALVTDGRLLDGVEFLSPLRWPGLRYEEHERQFGFSNRFRDNGDSDDPTARDKSDFWGYVRNLPGDGTYKLIRKAKGVELYRVRDDQGQQVGADPFELTPLDTTGAFRPQFVRLFVDAMALLETEESSN